MATYLFVATGSARGTQEWMRERMVTLAANMGYRLDRLYVEGRHYTRADDLRRIINMKKGDPIFSFDPDTARDLLLKLSWVKDVTVRRELPSTIYIELIERRPLALWQFDGRVRVVDETGAILTQDIAPFEALPLVVGAGANNQAADLLAELTAEPEVFKRLESAQWIGKRRWDLVTKGGVVVKLPEHDVGLALKQLGDAQRHDQLLEKDLVQIDLREADRLVIRTRPGVAEDYKVREPVKDRGT